MTKPILWADLETFSPVPIKNGTWVYAEQAEILLFPYAFGDEEPKCWDATTGEPMPAELLGALNDQEQETGWFNGGNFDSVILKHTHGIHLQPERILDVMVQSLSHAMPGSLDALCTVLGLGEDLAKNKEGKALIRLFCMPQPKGRKIHRATRETHPVEWRKFIEYAKQDIVSMRAAHKRLPRWNYPSPKERAIWNIDQRSNHRGVAIDVAFAHAAVRAADRAKTSLAAQCAEATNGEVQAATQRDALLDFILTEFGYSLNDMRKSTLERMLETPDLPVELRSLLEIRLHASATSVSKYQALINGTSSDGRMRGTVQFCGAVRSKRECLAENTQVVVKTPDGDVLNRNIQDVRLTDLLWDGDEWVAHEGVVYSGDKEVLLHDSILATAEHNVYISTSEYVPLGVAQAKGLCLWRGNDKSVFDISADSA